MKETSFKRLHTVETPCYDIFKRTETIEMENKSMVGLQEREGCHLKHS